LGVHSRRPQHHGSTQKENPKILAGTGYGKVAFGVQKV